MGKVCAYLLCRSTKLVIQAPHPSHPSATPHFGRAHSVQVPASPSHPRRPRSRVYRAPRPFRTPPFATRAVSTPVLRLKASSIDCLEGTQRQQRGQPRLAQRRRASSAATRPRPAAAASKATPRTTAELVSMYHRQGGIQAAGSPSCRIRQRDLQLSQVSRLSIGARAPGLPLEKDPAAPLCSGTKHTGPWGLSPPAGTGNLAPPAPSSLSF